MSNVSELPNNPILCGYKRENVWDSFFRGAFVVVKNKEVFVGGGDYNFTYYLRSSEKPLQSAAVVHSGTADAFGLDDEEIAIVAGSHNGEPIHTEVVKRMLAKGGMDFSNLECGFRPMASEIIMKLFSDGMKTDPQNDNCSGKHAGMLLMCKHMNAPTTNYCDRNHPVQQYIKKITADICEYPVEKVDTGLDGCGAQVHSMPIKNMAIGFENLANPDNAPKEYQETLRRVCNAMIKHPLMIGGHHRFCSDLNSLNGKVVAKGGAEGVYCAGFTGLNAALCIKVDSGDYRPWMVFIPYLLKELGVINDEEYAPLEKKYVQCEPNGNGDKVADTHIFYKVEGKL